MWTLVGRGWGCARALAPRATGAALLVAPGPRPAPTLGAAPESWATNRLYSSAEFKGQLIKQRIISRFLINCKWNEKEESLLKHRQHLSFTIVKESSTF
ncbi:GUF1 isoform 4 [Pan troglodytes]|uniref:GUF1 isoform 4 n=1 Tax=Pan troglodytes TaxID=9598 RepID=A0A2J8PGI1_PANTR|nr:GUF1 isoform 4 [Pan troglodytes]